MLELQELLEGALCMIQGIRMLLSLAVGYLLGGLSPAVMMGRIKGYDVRSGGTGNAGASNTVLMAGTLAGAVVAFLDILKAFAACMLGRALAVGVAFLATRYFSNILAEQGAQNAVYELRKKGFIRKGCFNDDCFDHTNWYTFTDYGAKMMEEGEDE